MPLLYLGVCYKHAEVIRFREWGFSDRTRIVTARIRRMGEGNVFIGVYQSTGGRGGRVGGEGEVRGMEGHVRPRQGNPPSLPSLPSLPPPSWPGQECPPFPSPPTLARTRTVVRRGRYASCVHAGGLSCLVCISLFFLLAKYKDYILFKMNLRFLLSSSSVAGSDLSFKFCFGLSLAPDCGFWEVFFAWGFPLGCGLDCNKSVPWEYITTSLDKIFAKVLLFINLNSSKLY